MAIDEPSKTSSIRILTCRQSRRSRPQAIFGIAMLVTLFSSICFRISCKDSRRALIVGFSWYCSRRRRAKIFEGFEGSVRHHLHVACCSSIEVAIVFLTYAIIIIITKLLTYRSLTFKIATPPTLTTCRLISSTLPNLSENCLAMPFPIAQSMLIQCARDTVEGAENRSPVLSNTELHQG